MRLRTIPRGTRGVAASPETCYFGLSTRHPRRRRDLPLRTIHAAPTASPRPAPSINVPRTRDAARSFRGRCDLALRARLDDQSGLFVGARAAERDAVDRAWTPLGLASRQWTQCVFSVVSASQGSSAIMRSRASASRERVSAARLRASQNLTATRASSSSHRRREFPHARRDGGGARDDRAPDLGAALGQQILERLGAEHDARRRFGAQQVVERVVDLL